MQVIPHVTDEIKRRIKEAGKGYDICIGEIGGTVGDIEGLPFLEAVRQLRIEIGREHVLFIHLTLVPYIATAGELKTKPTQHSVRELTSLGIQPDLIVLRSDHPVDRSSKQKIALFCNVEEKCVITALDRSSIYDVPLMLHDEGVDDRLCEKLNIWTGAPNLEKWRRIANTIHEPKNGEIRIAMVGKYVGLKESYKSLNEALVHGGIENSCKVRIEYVDSEELEGNELPEVITGADGILIPGGFGKRGTEGKIAAIKYARENNIPFLGICLGLQMAVVEFCRNVLSLKQANSGEFDPETPDQVIHLMEHQRDITDKGASMRLGAYPCKIKGGSHAERIYDKPMISERHRHRWEVNNSYRSPMEQNGMIMSGLSPDGELVEIVELPGHAWFVGVQFHPEFSSKPLHPHPLFVSYVAGVMAHRNKKADPAQAAGSNVVAFKAIN